jgi:spore photoproduct lyase
MSGPPNSEGSDTPEAARLGAEVADRVECIWATPQAAGTAVARRARATWPAARWRQWDGGPLPPADADLPTRALAEKRQLALTAGGPALRAVTRNGAASRTQFAVVHAWGCPCDCAYCYLQDEQTGWRPALRADTEAVLAEVRCFAAEADRPVRLHAGEVCDALALDRLTDLSGRLVDAVRPFPRTVTLELRTKTDRVGGLLAAEPAGNVVVGVTLCPARQARRFDFGAAPVRRRIEAAARCQQAGWRIGLRLDPIVVAAGWEARFDALLAELAERLDRDGIADVSLGVLRYDAALGRILRRRWPRLGIGAGEYHRCADGLYRPSRPVRSAVYRRLIGRLRAWLGEVPIELCMETAAVARDCGLEETACR